MGLMLLGYAGLALAIAVVAARDFDPRRLAATAGRFAVVSARRARRRRRVLAVGAGAAADAAVRSVLHGVRLQLGKSFAVHGRGDLGTAVPWYYLPTWIGITMPAVVLAGMAFAVVRLALPAPGRARLAALWALVLFPAVAAMARHVSLYDGMRHMLFIVPPMAVLAAAGWEFLLRSTPRPRRSRWLPARSALMIAEPVVFQIRNHPNQAVYFTPAIGGPRGAFGRYDLDYWGNCVLEATEWAACTGRARGDAARRRVERVGSRRDGCRAVQQSVLSPAAPRRLALNLLLLKGSTGEHHPDRRRPWRSLSRADRRRHAAVRRASRSRYPQLEGRLAYAPASAESAETDAMSELQARTIADFGEQWTDTRTATGFSARSSSSTTSSTRSSRPATSAARQRGRDRRGHRPLCQHPRRGRRRARRRARAVGRVSGPAGERPAAHRDRITYLNA